MEFAKEQAKDKVWIRKPLCTTHRIIISTPQICYICQFGVEYRNLSYIRPHQDLSPDIPHKTPFVKSSAIHPLPVETHPSLLNIILPWVSCSLRYRWRMFTLLRADIIFLLPFPLPLSYFISLLFGICFCDHHTLFIFHYQIWDSISFWWNF